MDLKKLSNVADVAAKIMNEKLHPNQQKLDAVSYTHLTLPTKA